MAILPFTSITPYYSAEDKLTTQLSFDSFKAKTDIPYSSKCVFILKTVPRGFTCLLYGSTTELPSTIFSLGRFCVFGGATKSFLNAWVFAGMRFLPPPDTFGTFKIGFLVVDNPNNLIESTDFVPENINYNEVFMDFIVSDDGDSSDVLYPISLGFQDYLSVFDKDVSSGDVFCFKCGSALSFVNNSLECENLHKYTFSEYILQHSSFLQSLILEIENNKICNT